jgi:hypothetical protein
VPFSSVRLIRSWAANTSPSGTYQLSAVGKIRCPDLRPTPVVEVITDKVGGNSITRALLALTALKRSPRVVGETRETGSKAASQVARRVGIDPTVRRLYLQRPESGAAELDALRADRQGNPRGHWVRGHWRNQYHASIDEHQLRWIEGYPRGDFSKGIVAGQSIQVVRGPRDDNETGH